MYIRRTTQQRFIYSLLTAHFKAFRRHISRLQTTKTGNSELLRMRMKMTRPIMADTRPCSIILRSMQFRGMSMSGINFPWQRSTIDLSKDDPLHHKLIGLFMLRKMVKNYSKDEFDLREFMDGVKHAVQNLSYCICTQDKDNKLADMLGSNLHTVFRQTFDSMKTNKRRIFLNIETSRDYKVSGVRSICGGADEGDEHEIKFLGQRIIASKRDMFELEKRSDSEGYSSIFQFGKEIGVSAAQKQIRFQIDVKFTTDERFYVEQKKDDKWDMIFGEKDIVTAKHQLRFESYLEDYEENEDKYPLTWKIVDIDFIDKK